MLLNDITAFCLLCSVEKRRQQVLADSRQKARDHTQPCPDMTGQPAFSCRVQRSRGWTGRRVLEATGRGHRGQAGADTRRSVQRLLSRPYNECMLSGGTETRRCTMGTGKRTNWHCDRGGFVYKEPEHRHKNTQGRAGRPLRKGAQELAPDTPVKYKRKQFKVNLKCTRQKKFM